MLLVDGLGRFLWLDFLLYFCSNNAKGEPDQMGTNLDKSWGCNSAIFFIGVIIQSICKARGEWVEILGDGVKTISFKWYRGILEVGNWISRVAFCCELNG
jgi:hypothetical protein